MKRALVIIVLVITLLIGVSGCVQKANTADNPDVYIGKILKITKDEISELDTSGGLYQQRIQEADVKIMNGPFKGEVIKVVNTMDQVLAYDIELFEGKEIYTLMEYDEQGEILHGYVYQYRRDKFIYFLIALFLVLMIGVGGVKGVRTVVTLVLTLVGIYYMLLGIMKGGNAIILAMIVCIVVTVVTMFIVAGFNQKAISAIIGTVGGVFVSGIIALVISEMSVLTGLGTTEAQMLMFTQGEITFDFASILFASILLGTLGAIMDVCMSIASSISEIVEANPFISTRDLFKSGMNIGRDIMGTMANTLILAYSGTSIFLILVFMINDIAYFDIINMDVVATEIIRALSGTIGLILCIPLTALVAAVLEKKSSKHYG